jgi:cell wall-associated NlpC family hydrolase
VKIDPRWISRKKLMKAWAESHGIEIPKGFRINPVNGSANKELMRRIQRKAYGADAANGKWQTRMAELIAPKLTVGQKMLALSRTQLGVREHPPGSNRGPQVDKYTGGVSEPWCADFQNWLYRQITGKNIQIPNYHYVPSYVEQARAGRGGLRAVSRDHARPGDLVTYDWGHDGVADHIGILATSVSAGGSFKAIEGNTSFGNDSNGGEVMERDRNVSSVASFIRIV